MIPSMQVLCKGSAESCARRGSQVTRLRRVGRLWVDAVEKVGATLTTRNNRIAQAGFLNRSCAFDARLELILLRRSPQNPFFDSIGQSRSNAFSFMSALAPTAAVTRRSEKSQQPTNACYSLMGRT